MRGREEAMEKKVKNSHLAGCTVVAVAALLITIGLLL